MTTTFDVEVEREFDAPIERVWHAWTEPEDLRAWWGPGAFTCPRAEADIRVGGRIAVTMRAPEEWGGLDYHSTWTITELEPGRRMAYVMRSTDETWTPISRTAAGLPEGVPDEGHHEVVLTPLGDGRTRLEMVEYGYPTEEVRDLSKSGLEQCLDKMAALVEGGFR